MNNKSLATVLVISTLLLAACSGHKGSDEDNSPLPGESGDNLNMQSLPENARPGGNFNPDRDVNYQMLASDTVYFAFDSSTIPGPEQAKLQQVSEWLKSNPGHSLFLAGHADKRGTPEYNRALGERRALSVREYLVGLGVPASALYTNSYGADRPAVEGDTEEAYAKNRRVEIGVIIKS